MRRVGSTGTQNPPSIQSQRHHQRLHGQNQWSRERLQGQNVVSEMHRCNFLTSYCKRKVGSSDVLEVSVNEFNTSGNMPQHY